MSTTVTYKGSTLTTVTNETRTLTTQGKYLEDNITLVDVTSGGSGSGAVWQDAQGYVHLSDEGDIELQTKTVSPTESAQTVLADAGYYALDRVNVNAIPSNYVGSGVTQRTSSDLTASGATVTAPSGYYSSSATKTVASGSATPASSISATGATVSTGTNTLTLSKSVSNTPTVSAGYVSSGTAGNSSVSLTASINTRSSSDLSVSGATVTAPAGYYASAASKAVASGTAGTPTATKGTVSNHAVTVTPSVTNTTGYITGSTKTGTGVSVSASELVSGTYSVTSSGTKDVTNYASASVPSGTEGTPTATKGTVSNHSVTVTPSVTNTAGYISGGTHNGTAVTVSASELVSGSETKTANGTYDVTNLAQIIVNVSGGGSSGLVYETGTWTPSEDVANYVILFANTYTTAPFYYMIADTSGSYSDATYTNYFLMYANNHQLFGEATYPGPSGYSPNYGNVLARYRGTNASTFSGTQIQLRYPYTDNNPQNINYSRYWATETGIKAYSNLDSRYWRAGRTYKWIAAWLPTT